MAVFTTPWQVAGETALRSQFAAVIAAAAAVAVAVTAEQPGDFLLPPTSPLPPPRPFARFLSFSPIGLALSFCASLPPSLSPPPPSLTCRICRPPGPARSSPPTSSRCCQPGRPPGGSPQRRLDPKNEPHRNQGQPNGRMLFRTRPSFTAEKWTKLMHRSTQRIPSLSGTEAHARLPPDHALQLLPTQARVHKTRAHTAHTQRRTPTPAAARGCRLLQNAPKSPCTSPITTILSGCSSTTVTGNRALASALTRRRRCCCASCYRLCFADRIPGKRETGEGGARRANGAHTTQANTGT